MSRGGRRVGRYHATVESCHSLTAWGYFQECQHDGLEDDQLDAEWEFNEDSCQIRYSRDGGQELVEHISLTYTPCRYGGRRTWFVCPRCRRRVGKIYLPTTYFHNVWKRDRVNRWLCRYCWYLTYEQRRARDLYWCMNWRADRIAARWLGGITEDLISRRRGQHWSTFTRRADQYEAAIVAANGFMIASLAGRFPDLLR
jgi:hypothetical protein